jgi:translation elongation factor EF-1alpha
MSGIQIGQVSHYFDHLNVASLVLSEPLCVGETIHILGHSTDFQQKVTSLQIERESVEAAKPGDNVGIKVIQKVHAHDKVYKLKDE